MQLHLEALDRDRKIIFAKLTAFKKYGYLAGGTALALQLGHRISYDFDIFCEKEISQAIIYRAKKEFSIGETLINSKEEFTFIDGKGIKISFIYYPFDLNNFVIKNPKKINILSVKGIALAKAYTLDRRGSWRDYVDLYFILKNKKTSLEEVIKGAKKIYKGIFSEKLFLSQLVYTDDISRREVAETKFLGKKATLRQIKSCFKKEIDSYDFLKREAEADKDIAHGRVYGPFKNTKELLKSLKK